MKTVTYELFRGFINRYVSSGTFTRPQQFTPATLSGEINEWLDKGFAIHENPCRKEFLAARVGTLPPYQDVLEAGVGKEVSAFDQTRKTELFFPFGNIGYDASFFYHCPTYLRTYCAVQVNVPEAEEAEAELSTCGGMTVWVNGTPVTDFVPFTRNLVKKTRVTLPFAAGANRLVVCLDDLAERDTDYYFRIRYLGSQTLTMELPLPEGAEPEAVKHAERVLDSLHFTRESYCAEDVCVCLGEQPAAGETIVAASGGNTFKPAALPAEGAGAVYRVAPSAAFPPAYTPFSFSIACGGVTITRRAGCQVADAFRGTKVTLPGQEKDEAGFVFRALPDGAAALNRYTGKSRKNLVIPGTTPSGRPVTEIDDYAFMRTPLGRATFGRNVASIGRSAFETSRGSYWMLFTGDAPPALGYEAFSTWSRGRGSAYYPNTWGAPPTGNYASIYGGSISWIAYDPAEGLPG